MSILDNFQLTGHKALVTGAGRGIGKAIALALADAGADVVCAARTQADIDQVAAEIAAKGRNGIGIACNVALSNERTALVAKATDALGGLSLLVNNAGGAGPNNPRKTSATEFTGTFDFNVSSAFDLIREAAPTLIKSRRGSVINISSASAHLVQKNFSAYGTAKAALSYLTRMLAQDFAPDIRINAIEPGPILTDALESYLSEEAKAHMIQSTPLQRLGDVEDIAAASVYLASPAASWISGKILQIDGGAESAW